MGPNWIRIDNGMKPLPGSQIVAFTPTANMSLRYRVVDAGSLDTLSEATHWAFLTPPVEHWDARLSEGKYTFG